DLVATCTRDEGVEQDHLQIAAMDRELRMLVAGGAAERLLVDQLAKTVEEGGVRRCDRGPGQIRLEPERGELLRCMRQQIDADADRLDRQGGLENTAGNFGLMQRERERQPTN